MIPATLEKTVNKLSNDDKLELVAKIVTGLRVDKKSARAAGANETEKKKKILKQLTKKLRSYAISARAPLKFTRDQLHDRR